MENKPKQNKLQGWKKVKHYILLSQLGRGMFGEVWQGVNEQNNQIIACKVVPKENLKKPKLKQLFITEVKYMKLIENENVVKLIDYFESQNTCYIVMEFCDGGDLEKYLQEKVTLDEDEALEFTKQILNGFKGFHEHNIIHRDFKAANVFLHEGQIKIGDLGFAKQTLLTNTVLGTPLYMAPEVLNHQQYTNKSDMWSLGILLYQMLFGVPPFYAQTEKELINVINKLDINFNRKGIKISAKCEDLIRKILVIDPNLRIEWKQLYDHPLLNDEVDLNMLESNNVLVKQIMSSIQIDNPNRYHSNQLLKSNKGFYEQKMLGTFQLQPQKVHDTTENEQQTAQQQEENKQNQPEIQEEKNQTNCQNAEDIDKAFKEQLKLDEEKQMNRQQTKTVQDMYLHQKQKYVQIGKLISNCLQLNYNQQDYMLYFILSKQYLLMNNTYLKRLHNNENIHNLDNKTFQTFIKSSYYKKLVQQVQNDEENNIKFFELILNDIEKQEKVYKLDQKFEGLFNLLKPHINKDLSKNFSDAYKQIILFYYGEFQKAAQQYEGQNNANQAKVLYKLCFELLDCLMLDVNFPLFIKKGNVQQVFDFQQYNKNYTQLSLGELKQQIEAKFEQCKKN